MRGSRNSDKSDPPEAIASVLFESDLVLILLLAKQLMSTTDTLTQTLPTLESPDLRSESDYLKRPTVTQYLFISMSLVLSTDGAALCQL